MYMYIHVFPPQRVHVSVKTGCQRWQWKPSSMLNHPQVSPSVLSQSHMIVWHTTRYTGTIHVCVSSVQVVSNGVTSYIFSSPLFLSNLQIITDITRTSLNASGHTTTHTQTREILAMTKYIVNLKFHMYIPTRFNYRKSWFNKQKFRTHDTILIKNNEC